MRLICPERRRSAWLRLTTLLALLAAVGPAAAMSFWPGLDSGPAAAPTPARSLPVAEAVLVRKAQRRLYLLRDGRPYRTYRVHLGARPEGPKLALGDKRTPEGHYRVTWRNAGSRFHRALHISYPNAQDRARAAAAGVDPGGSIAVHGEPGGRNNAAVRALLAEDDWTEGCIAVTNPAIEELWRLVPAGTPVEIRP